MKKVIERMNAGVTAEQQRALAAASGSLKDKDGSKKRWLGVGGMVKKVTGGSGSGSASASGTASPAPALAGEQVPADEGDPMRVDFYLVVFLKFIASIVPTIEVDSTTPF
jgi:ubiquitin-like-conjugating enzyme ATG3